METQIGFKVFKSQIRKFLGSFRYRKSANFLDVPVRKSQIRKLLWLIGKSQIRKSTENCTILTDNSPKSCHFKWFIIIIIIIC